MKQSRIIWFLLACFILVFGIAAAEPDESPASSSHCYALLSPVVIKSDDASRILETDCFNTFAEAIEAATQGRVHLDPDVRPEDLTDGILNNVNDKDSMAAQVVIGIDWDSPNYGGSSYTWVVADSGCTDILQYSVSSMPVGWNDRVSSAKAYSGCSYYYHYQNSNFGGSSVTCNTDCSTMGSLDNATSSEKWKKSP